MSKISFEKLSIELVEDLSSRVKEVLVGRFGLDQQPPQTLEAVGREHEITRERVRQIVQEGLIQLRENMQGPRSKGRITPVFGLLEETLRREGFMKREDLLLELLKAKEEINHILFFLALGDQFYNQRETQDFHSFWTLKKDMVEKAVPLHQRLMNFFKKKKALATQQEVCLLYGKEAPLYLEVSKFIEKSPYGAWGLRRWPEVNPRGMKDKAYLVLDQERRPLHFTEVSNLIVKMQERLAPQKRKAVLPQTVHNELIKDPRFVLTGRGTYGLQSWGLQQGTIKDIMRSILERNGKTMEKGKLIAKILQQRQVKESTIALNLQDRRYFLKNQDGTYTLRI
jgi:DNA-directed RNA polymerase delta subunit